MSQWRTPVVVLIWIPVTLGLDAGATLLQQHLLGVMTWVLLFALLRSESALVRIQTGVVVVFATAVEYTFSPWLEVYTYRFDNVPSFVPPGHGLVYLAALCMGRSDLFQRWSRQLVWATVVLGGLYAAWGMSPLAPRQDVLGLFWYACLLGFLAWGRSRMLYVGAFVVVTYLEVIGTWLGTWTWQPYDPTGLVSMGNPPSGAAGGYGWFDLAAITLAPLILRWWTRDGEDPAKAPADDSADDPANDSALTEGIEEGVVQMTVGGDSVPTDHR